MTCEAIRAVESQGQKALPLAAGIGNLTKILERAISIKDLMTMGQAMTKAQEKLAKLGSVLPESG